MPNFAQTMKAEVSRLARKEVKAAVTSLKSDNAKLKKSNADLRKRVARLEKDNKRLMEAEKKRLRKMPRVAPKEIEKARVTAKGIRSMRRNLKLSQVDFGKLLGVSPVTVYNWEKSKGALKLRQNTRAAVLGLRGIGAREAKARLQAKGKTKGKK